MSFIEIFCALVGLSFGWFGCLMLRGALADLMEDMFSDFAGAVIVSLVMYSVAAALLLPAFG